MRFKKWQVAKPMFLGFCGFCHQPIKVYVSEHLSYPDIYLLQVNTDSKERDRIICQDCKDKYKGVIK